MDIKTLESLGIDPAELGNRIVDQAVECLLASKGFNPETDEETTYESRFKREIQERIQKAVDQKIADLAEIHLIPKVGEMIERANLQKTNNYGEKKGEPMTFIEYIAERASVYMTEDCDINGKTRSEGDTYSWRSCGPRLTVLMRSYIRDTLEKHAKNAVADVNKVIADNMKKAAIDAINSVASGIKVSVAA